MVNPFIGNISATPYNFAVRGWALCQGQLLPIAQNTALFAILGTTYGGDGRTTLGLPDLQGRAIIHPGRGAGLSPFREGQRGGASGRTLSLQQLPAHDHAGGHFALGGPGDAVSANNGYVAESVPGGSIYTGGAISATSRLGAEAVRMQPAGSGQSFQAREPYLAINFQIALQGSFPSRS